MEASSQRWSQAQINWEGCIRAGVQPKNLCQTKNADREE